MDATVTLGQDFPAFLASQAAKTAATTSAPSTTEAPSTSTNRRTSTTSKRTASTTVTKGNG